MDILSDKLQFPSPENTTEDGIIALGGDLSAERLLLAYREGIFPWYSEGSPIIWWCPDPRFILYPDHFKVSKSLRQVLRKGDFSVTYDRCFEDVMTACGSITRAGQDDTWITENMKSAYQVLHQKGYAHSVEVWQNDDLVGGLYGVSLGRTFFGESMFAKTSNASKVGFAHLMDRLSTKGFDLIDCQVYTEHLESLGAEEIPREQFLRELKQSLKHQDWIGSWQETST